MVDIVFHQWCFYSGPVRCDACRILLTDWERLIYRADGSVSNIQEFDCFHILQRSALR